MPSHILYFHPVLMPALVLALIETARRARRDLGARLLAAATGPVLAFFVVVMIRVGDSEPHWPLVGHLGLAVACAGLVDEQLSRRRRLVVPYLGVAAVFTATVGFAYLLHSRTPALMLAVPAERYDAALDPVNETLGWDQLRAAILDETARLGPAAVVAGNHNVVCGHLLAALDDLPPVFCPSPRRTAFDFLGRREPPGGVPVLYVENLRYPATATSVLPGRACRAPRPFDVRRGGRVVARFALHACPPRRQAHGA